MKKLAIALLALLLLAAAGGGTWWFFLRDRGATVASADTTPAFYNLPPMTVPIVRNNQVLRVMSVEIALQMPNKSRKGAVEALLPRLTDAFLVELYGLFARRLMQERDYDLALVKTRLLKVATEVAGKDTITDVLIKSAR